MIGLTYGIFNLLWGCMSPIAGAFAEQKGYVKTLIVGFIGISFSFYITSSAINPLHFLFGLGVIGGLSAGIISVPVIIGGVSKYFEDDKTRSTVTGILMSLAASGMFIFTPINQFLVSTFQWSMSFQIVSVFFLLFIPMSLIFLIPKPVNKNKKEYTPRKISDVIKTATRMRKNDFIGLKYIKVLKKICLFL